MLGEVSDRALCGGDHTLGEVSNRALSSSWETLPKRGNGPDLRGKQQFSQEQPRTQSRLDQIGVLAHKTQPGPDSQVSLQHRAGIDVRTVGHWLTRLSFHTSRQLTQARQQHVVIVAAPGIASDNTAGRLVAQFRGQGTTMMVGAHHQYRANARQDSSQIRPLGHRVRPGQVGHSALVALLQPGLVAAKSGGRLSGYDAHQVKAQPVGRLRDPF